MRLVFFFFIILFFLGRRDPLKRKTKQDKTGMVKNNILAKLE